MITASLYGRLRRRYEHRDIDSAYLGPFRRGFAALLCIYAAKKIAIEGRRRQHFGSSHRAIQFILIGGSVPAILRARVMLAVLSCPDAGISLGCGMRCADAGFRRGFDDEILLLTILSGDSFCKGRFHYFLPSLVVGDATSIFSIKAVCLFIGAAI